MHDHGSLANPDEMIDKNSMDLISSYKTRLHIQINGRIELVECIIEIFFLFMPTVHITAEQQCK